MKLRASFVLALFWLCGVASGEGGCPTGYTPVNNGQNWACVPGGNDSTTREPGSQIPLAPQPTGYWQTTWGAIAGNPTTGILGSAVGARSKTEAVRRAIGDCEEKGGGRGCRVEIAYHNQCAVMVVGDNGSLTARAGSIEEASRIGIEKCGEDGDRECRVYYSACSDSVFHKY